MKKRITVALITIIFACVCAPNIYALKANSSYIYDTQGNSVAAPISYVSIRRLYGRDLQVGALSSPKDLFVDSQGMVYVADSGNNRILIFDSQFRHIKTVSEVLRNGVTEPLDNPCGVFMSDRGVLYICDTGNSRVLGVNKQGEVIRYMDNEGIIALNKNFVFKPEKVVVDTSDNVYIVDSSIYQGIIQYDNYDRFAGFFAPNSVEVTANVLFLQVWKRFFTDEQRDSIEKVLPSSYNNLYIDKENFLYTSAINVSTDQALKRLNYLGVNILQSTSNSVSLGDQGVEYDAKYQLVKTAFVDVHISEEGILCGADSTKNRLFLYDTNYNLITIFGGSGDQMGLFKSISSVDMLGDYYLVLDSAGANITVFEPTPYMQEVILALSFYKQGQYIQSADLWEKLLLKNSNLTIAYRSIGRSYLQQGKFKLAMNMLKHGGDKYFYSMALKEYRKEFVRENMGLILALLGVFVLATAALAISIKKARGKRER